MCARRSRSSTTSAPRGVRLPSALDEAIGLEAERRGRSWSSMTTELLDEAVRQRRAPGIVFVDGATGRRAVVAGTGIDVWEVVRSWQAQGEDVSSTLEALPMLSEMQVRSAVGYYRLYPEEIDARLEREESWTAERLEQELPQARPRSH